MYQSSAAVSACFWQGCLGRGCQSEGVLFPGEVAGVSGCLRPRPAGTSEEDSLTEAGGRSGYSSLQGPFPCLLSGRERTQTQAAFSLHFFPCRRLELLLGTFLPLGALLPLISHHPGAGVGWQACVSRVAAPLPMGTAWHECPLPPSPNQQLPILSHPSGQK